MKTRIEIHLSESEVAELDAQAKKQGRSRKNFCETAVKEAVIQLQTGELAKKLQNTALSNVENAANGN